MTGGVVVVLGETGKNFAAGMSGGVAYIYDPNKKFEPNFNNDMADIEGLEEEDYEVIRRLVREHFRFTASQSALDILQNWNQLRGHFIKVMPRDYKTVLQKRKQKELAEKVG
jgi:glutamate synthase (NADPH/NADH) large chain